ncbi:MAG: ABC transporter substrate-binding protein [Betaproteobacteria bacterium]|nr:ABC transporter substrate-binding protein [Betaproteobacteria bacterium]
MIRSVVTCLLAWAAGLGTAHAAGDCELARPIRFAGNDWASNSFHVALASHILAKGYGCEVTSVPGTTQPLLNALAKGDVDISMELWKDNNVEIWNKIEKSGRALETRGVSIQGAIQGWWVPRYLVEGDARRGIKAKAPGLRTVSDLPRHKALFGDPEQPAKGRFYNCKLGWNCEKVNSRKLEAYGLLAHYSNFRPGSGAALDAAIASAYRRGRPILFYYWGPTWVLGRYDLVRLEEPAYDKAIWDALDKAESGEGLRACAYPTIRVTIAVNRTFADAAPGIVGFLDRYRMQDEHVNQALVFMRENKDRTGAKAAREFLRKHTALWSEWLPAEVAQRVRTSLLADHSAR